MRSFLPFCLCILIAACGSASDDSAAAAPSTDSDAAMPIEVARQVRDLVSALTPPPPTSNSAIMSDFHNRRREVLTELKAGGPELGRAVKRELLDNPDHILDVRRGLLEVAAFTVPNEMEAELVELVTVFGEDLGLRTKACELLAATHPAKAVEVLEPLITDARPGLTLPPADIMVKSYADAAKASGHDAIDPLTEIATNLFIDETARLYAVRAVATYTGSRAREAIRILVIESTGNGYLRRMAVRALLDQAKIDPETEAVMCTMLTEITDKETDVNFMQYMINVLEKHCQ